MAASKAHYTLYRKALLEVVDANVYVEKRRAAIIKAGCTHPIDFLEPWTFVIHKRARDTHAEITARVAKILEYVE